MGTKASQLPSGLRGGQYVLLLAGEAAWLYAWCLALGAAFGGRPVLGLPTVAALLVLAAIATRLAVAGRRPHLLARVALGLLGLAAAGMVAYGPLLAARGWANWARTWDQFLSTTLGLRAAAGAALALFVWWRGITIGRVRPTLYTAEAKFRTGIFATASLLVVVALAGGASAPLAGYLILPTLVVVSAGLIGMPLARIAEVGERPRHRDSPGLAPGGPWLTMLLGVVTGLLLVTLLLAQLFTFERIGALLAPLHGPLEAMLWVVLYVVALPVALLLEGLIRLARLLLPRLNLEFTLPDIQRRGLLEQLQEQEETGAANPELLFVLKVLAALVLVAIVVGLLARAIVRRRDSRQADDVEEIRDFVWSWPGLEAIWRWLLAWLRRRRPQPLPAIETRRASVGVGRSVRELYREFLALGAAIGRTRRPAETPLEYEGRLHGEGSLPGGDEIGSITESYVQVRYGPPDWTSPDVKAMASALARLRALWQGWLLAARAKGRRSGVAMGRPAPGRADAGDGS